MPASLRTAIAFFWPIGASGIPADERTWRRALWWFIPLGIVVGLLWVWIFALCKKQFWQAEALHVIPALAVVVIDSLLLGHRLLIGLALSVDSAVQAPQLRGPKEGDSRQVGLVAVLVLVLAVMLLTGALLTIPAGRLWWPGGSDPRRYLNWAYPSPIYRPLLLAPLWGRWAVLLAAIVGRPSSRASTDLAMISKVVSPAKVLLLFIVPWFLTAIYCSRHRNLVIGTLISLIVLAVSYLVALVMVYRGSGQTKDSVLGTGAVAQLTFLITYLAFTWQIHG